MRIFVLDKTVVFLTNILIVLNNCMRISVLDKTVVLVINILIVFFLFAAK